MTSSICPFSTRLLWSAFEQYSYMTLKFSPVRFMYGTLTAHLWNAEPNDTLPFSGEMSQSFTNSSGP